jgi:hypothetical protein
MSSPTQQPEPPNENWGYDLLLYGNEQILRGSDNGTLVAFAALAFQQIRGKGEPHQDIGCGFLLFSVLMCALIHLAIGNVYVGRARKIIRRQAETQRHRLVSSLSLGVAWVAAIIQFLCIIIGIILVLADPPPQFLQDYVLAFF